LVFSVIPNVFNAVIILWVLPILSDAKFSDVLSIVTLAIAASGIIGTPLAITGIITGVIGRREAATRRQSTWGLLLGALYVILAVASTFISAYYLTKI